MARRYGDLRCLVRIGSGHGSSQQGLPLAGLAPGLEDGLLVAVTERRTKEDIDRLADAMATVTRRTLSLTRAPIFSSLRRIVPQLARANWVNGNPIRRRALSSTYAIEANHRRNWLACMLAAEV